MSIKAMQYVFESTSTKGQTRLIFLLIADETGAEGNERFFINVRSIAKKANCSAIEVWLTIDDLIEMGELLAFDDIGEYPNTARSYSFKISKQERNSNQTTTRHHAKQSLNENGLPFLYEITTHVKNVVITTLKILNQSFI